MKLIAIILPAIAFLYGSYVSYKWMGISQKLNDKVLLIINWVMMAMQFALGIYILSSISKFLKAPLNVELSMYSTLIIIILFTYYLLMFNKIHNLIKEK